MVVPVDVALDVRAVVALVVRDTVRMYPILKLVRR